MDAVLRSSFVQPRLRAAVLPDEPGAVCHVLDAKYRPGVRCLVLYRLADRLVRGELRFDGEDGAQSAAIGSGGLRVWAYPDDPDLPSLRQTLAPGALEAALEPGLAAITSGRPRVLRTRATLLRYRPGKRATLLIDVRLRTPLGVQTSATYIGKVYHDVAKAAFVYQETSLLGRTPPVRSGRIVLAAPVAFLPDLAMTLQTPVAGAPLDLLLYRAALTGVSARGRQGVLCAADALAALHSAPPVSTRPRPVTGELVKLAHRASQIAAVDPEVGAVLVALTDALFESVPQQADECLVHGDCKPSQFRVARGSVALLDFDHCGVADPASDVGTFLATLRQLRIKHTPATPADGELLALGDAFLRAYLAARGAGRALADRARWHESVALTRKALRAYARAPFSPLPLRLAEAAHACLGAYADVKAGRSRK